MTRLLETRQLHVAIGGHTLVRKLDFKVAAGEIVCLLGRNGTGKTSTLHTLAGLLPACAGTILIEDTPLEQWPRDHLAQRMTLLMQHYEDPFPGSVLETALIGRHPHIGRWSWEDSDDIAIAMNALGQVGLAAAAQRDIATLSGGERRRLAIATVLTQQPVLHLLDEPLNDLDPHHQLAVLKLFRAHADRGAAVIASVHDVNLAARFADRVVMLHGRESDGAWEAGRVEEMLEATRLAALFRTEFVTVKEGGRRFFLPV